MPTTFSYVPSYGSPVSTELRVRSMAFGNGYGQDVKDGINNKKETYSLLFDKMTDVDFAAVIAFLNATEGSAYFLWTPPMAGHNTEKKFKCKKFEDESLQYNCNRITAVFEQVFDP